MPEIRPARADEGSLFCFEHPIEPATKVLHIRSIRISLCERCFAALADQMATARFSPTRNSWTKAS